MMHYRLVHSNCARPIGTFDPSNKFVPVFVALLPRIFQDADAFGGLIHLVTAFAVRMEVGAISQMPFLTRPSGGRPRFPRSRSGVRRTTSGRSAIPAILTRLACDASPMKPTAATDLAS